MATEGVEIPKSCDCAPAERKVPHVDMVKTTGNQPKVECGTGKDTVDEVLLEVGICFEEGAQMVDIVRI